jgi:hypothetical protein
LIGTISIVVVEVAYGATVNLSTDDILKAAKVAASKYFSTDQAIDRDDLVSLATLRILDRDPTTMATAVHVGREGIMREIGYRRYEKATNTIQFSVFDADQSVPMQRAIGANSSDVEKKWIKWIKNTSERMGPPVEMFGRFGLAYQSESVCTTLINRFKSPGRIGKRNKRLIYSRKISDVARQIADLDYVLVILVHGELQQTLGWCDYLVDVNLTLDDLARAA